MRNNNNEKNPQDFFQEIVERAWKDESFKQELIHNPVSILSQLSGKDFSLFKKNIIVVDQSDAKNIYINIPAKPKRF